MLGLGKTASREAKIAARLLEDARAAARRPEFYGEGRAPDTLDGRFDMMVLHVGLVVDRLAEAGPRASAVSQALFDLFFDDMDAALREIGVGDMSVGKKIRRMGEAFYGRARAYRDALAQEDDGAVEDALRRNLFEQGEPEPAFLSAFARYVRASAAGLAGQDAEALLDGGSPAWGRF